MGVAMASVLVQTVPMDGSELLDRHIESFNHGVRTGDYEPMLALFADDAELIFAGPPVGPFHGKDEIRAGYAAAPPDDTMRAFDLQIDGDRLTAGYAWDAAPEVAAGELILERSGDQIRRLIVRFT